MIKTKSIQAPINQQDGLRICVMRKPGEYNDSHFDMWLPKLSPSHQLLNSYNSQKTDWQEYLIRFEQEVLSKQGRLFNMLIDLSKSGVVTLLCWELSPKRCHRRLLAEHLVQLDPEIKVEIS